jgi:hypothetical protein
LTEEEWVEARLAEAPEFTPEQVEKLRRLLAIFQEVKSGGGESASA